MRWRGRFVRSVCFKIQKTKRRLNVCRQVAAQNQTKNGGLERERERKEEG